MLVMLAYDLPETKHQTLLRKEFEALGGHRVQYSIYVFEGEPHECDRVIRYMRRVASQVEGDVRLFPMDKTVWEAQLLLCTMADTERKPLPFKPFVVVWETASPC
jgi:CRISPR-associated endonuclease Cas2